MNPILSEEHAHAINGVDGRMFARTAREDEAEGAFCSQTWKSESRPIDGYEHGARLRVNIRFDDSCRNGHNTFSMTGDIFRIIRQKNGVKIPYGREEDLGGGACHDDIAKVFPELAPLVKWHLVSTDGPMHYFANTLYHAGDRDHYGLRKGERSPLVNGKTGLPLWELEAVTGGPQGIGVAISDTPTGLKYIGRETVPLFILKNQYTGETPPATPLLRWVQSYRIGEGKERQLDFARSSAVWPEATDEELSADPSELRVALEARLPALMAEFRRDIEAAGFQYERETANA